MHALVGMPRKPNMKDHSAMATKQVSLDMRMPNGKRVGDCTFAEVANNFTMGELVKIYPDLGFWFRLVGAGYASDDPAPSKPKKRLAIAKTKSSKSKSQINGSRAGFIDDDEDRNPEGVLR